MSLNYKNIALRTIQEFVNENPNMTLAEIIYSFTRKGITGLEFKDIKNMTDEQLYSAIEKAKQFEKE